MNFIKIIECKNDSDRLKCQNEVKIQEKVYDYKLKLRNDCPICYEKKEELYYPCMSSYHCSDCHYSICPKIIKTAFTNRNEFIIEMEYLEGDTLYKKYGDNPLDIPGIIWDDIRDIVNFLYEEGIEYIDITPFNFIEKNDKIYIIDFGHASFIDEDHEMNWFLKEFLDGESTWNPDFK